MSDILRSSEDKPLCLPYGGEGGLTTLVNGKRVKHADVLEYIRRPRAGQSVHSDGVLYVTGKWDCAVSGHRPSNTMAKFCLNCWVDL